MADTSKKEVSRRDRAYYRRRQQNRVFSAIAALFAEEAAKGNISKKELSEILDKDPAQITRWLSEPRNLELDTISDMLLAMGAEMDPSIVRFKDRPKANFAHSALTRYLTASPTVPAESSLTLGPKISTASASTADKTPLVTSQALHKEEAATVDG